MTNWNPYLLQEASSVHKRYWKYKYDDIFEAHLHASISQEVEFLTSSTFDVLWALEKLLITSLN